MANSRLCDGRNHGALSLSVLRVNCLICEEAPTGHNVLLSPGILRLLFLLAVVQSSSFTFCKGFCTVQLPGTPVFMLQLSQQLFKTLSLSDSLFPFFSFPPHCISAALPVIQPRPPCQAILLPSSFPLSAKWQVCSALLPLVIFSFHYVNDL